MFITEEQINDYLLPDSETIQEVFMNDNFCDEVTDIFSEQNFNAYN